MQLQLRRLSRKQDALPARAGHPERTEIPLLRRNTSGGRDISPPLASHTESNPNSDPKLATHTTNVYSPHKLLTNRLIPEIISFAIPPIDQTIAEDAAGSGETLHVRHTIISEEIVTNAVHSAAQVFRTHVDVRRHGAYETTPQDGNTAIGFTLLNYPVRIGGSTTGSSSRTGNQDIISPRGSIST